MWPCQTCFHQSSGKLDFIPWNLSFPWPCWKADVSSSFYNKCSGESQDKVTFRLWGSPHAKAFRLNVEKKKFKKAIIRMLNSWVFGKLNLWLIFKNSFHECFYVWEMSLKRKQKSIKLFLTLKNLKNWIPGKVSGNSSKWQIDGKFHFPISMPMVAWECCQVNVKTSQHGF